MPAKSPPPSPPLNPVARFLRSAFRPGILALAAIAATGWFLGPYIRRALPPIEDRDEYKIRAADVEVPDMPGWLPADFVAQSLRRAGLREELSLLDDRLTADVAEAFRLNPWVRNVVRVEKQFPARVIAELEFREPVAMVQVERGLYPVDAHGVLLPPEDFSASETHRYPTIAGVKSTPQGPAGSSWGDPVVVAGAKVAAALLPEWRTLGLVAFRVVEPAGRKPEAMTFELLAPRGSRILWGRPPGTDHPGELTTDQKLGRLKEYVARFGDFDAPQGPYEIDIRHWQEISRRPLAAGPANERR